MINRFCLVLLCCAVVAPVQADQTMTVEDAWIRHVTGDRPMAGYAVLHNSGDAERRLVGGSSDAFGSVQIHESMETDGAAGMRHVDAVAVPAGGSASLEPGGYHLMLMRPQQALEVGDQVSITLEFADGARRSAMFSVKPVWQE